MTILQTDEAPKVDAIATLEAAAQAAQAALDACPNPDTWRYPPPASMRGQADAERNKLAGALGTAKRALAEAKRVQHNQSVYNDILQKNTEHQARIAAEKVAQELQQAGVNEAAFKEKALQAYLAAGGTNLGFAGEWQSLRAELVRQKTISALTEIKPSSLVDEWIAARNSGRK
jgi:hypothetical protein